MNTLTSLNPTLLTILVIWTIPWKIFALWTASRKNQKWWFVILAIVNTFGILEIIYIFFVAKKSGKDMSKAFHGLFTAKK